jgi:hypothetical protein
MAAFAPSLEEIARGVAVTLEEAAGALRRLDGAHHLKLLDGTDRILMAFPFSGGATPYRVTRSNGQRYFANCAWDAIAFHPMLAEPIGIRSFCHHCGDPIEFRVESGRGVSGTSGLPVLFLKLRASEWWTDIVRTCSNTMVFFTSREHLGEFRNAVRFEGGAELSVEQTVRLSVPIYQGRMDRGYERPPKAVLQAHFDRLGLSGDFWKL